MIDPMTANVSTGVKREALRERIASYYMPDTLIEAMFAVLAERQRQDDKWGDITNFDSRPPEKWLTILAEEFGELAQAFLKRDQENALEEATQVAAVAVAVLESLQRRGVTERSNDKPL